MNGLHFTEDDLRKNPRYAHLIESERTKASKYHNVRLLTEDGAFDSQAEHKRWLRLKLTQKHGVITALMRQVRFALWTLNPKTSQKLRDSVYVADFVYLEIPEGLWVIEDCKGVRTREYLRKKRLMLEIYGLEILET